MKPLKVKMSITVDEDVAQRVKDLAEQDERSVSQYINLVLKAHLAEQDDNEE